MVADILQVLSIDVYALLFLIASLSFVTPLVAKKFDVLPDILVVTFVLTTPVADSVVTRKAFRIYPVSLPNKVTWVELVELDMVYFDVI